MSVNVNGVILSTFIARELMRTDKGGSGGVILNIASVLGLYPINFVPVYTASKHAVTGFTRAMGHDNHFKQTGIEYMTICPGVTDTPLIVDMTSQLWDCEWSATMTATVASMKLQKADIIGETVVHAIKSNKKGSTWICDGNIIKEAEIKDAWHL